MSEIPKKHREHPKAKESTPSSGKSDLRRACAYITRGVHRGVLTASLATNLLGAAGCNTNNVDVDVIQENGPRKGKKDGGHHHMDGGHRDMVDTVDGSMGGGLDGGGSKGAAVDGGGSKDEDGGSSLDAGGSMGGEVKLDAGVDDGGSKGAEADAGGSKDVDGGTNLDAGGSQGVDGGS